MINKLELIILNYQKVVLKQILQILLVLLTLKSFKNNISKGVTFWTTKFKETLLNFKEYDKAAFLID